MSDESSVNLNVEYSLVITIRTSNLNIRIINGACANSQCRGTIEPCHIGHALLMRMSAHNKFCYESCINHRNLTVAAHL